MPLACHWIRELADFNFTIHYRPGKRNIDADALSRMPSDDMAYMKTYTQIVPPDALQAVACSAKSQDQGKASSMLRHGSQPHLHKI